MVASIYATQQPSQRSVERAARATIIPIGDSRVPWVLDPATKRQKGATDLSNVACALSDQKYTTLDGFGVSGQRVDQYLSNLPTAVALNPGVIFFPSILNSIGQDYPTQATSGSDAASRILAAAQTAIAAGILVIVMSEMATADIADVRLAQVNIYNGLMQSYAAQLPNLIFLDVRPYVCDANNRLIAGYTYDNTHLNQYGAIVAGRRLQALLDVIMPANLGFTLNSSGIPLVGGYTQLALNPRFATTTGGSTSTGATGTFAGSCTFNKTGASSALAVTSALENVQLACTFGAAADNCRMATTASNAAWNSGDIVRGMALVEVSGTPTGLAGIELNMVANGDSVSTTYADLSTNTGWAGPNGSMRYLLLTQEYAIPTYTSKGSLSVTVLAKANGAGSATVTVRQIGILRKA